MTAPPASPAPRPSPSADDPPAQARPVAPDGSASRRGRFTRFAVGLTGGIGSGKSTVADLFVARGATLVDSDAIAHELTGPAGDAMPAITAAFGPGIVAADGRLDRAAMRTRVFTDPDARRRLESILHPMIRALAEARIDAAAGAYVIVAIPLLIESVGWRQALDRVLIVDCPVETQIERVIRRNGLSRAEVEAVIAAQVSREQRLAAADDVIDNGGAPEALAPQVEALHRRYLELARG